MENLVNHTHAQTEHTPDLLANLLRPDDRLLILGGSGWFGHTLHTLIGDTVTTHATASNQRPGYHTWDASRIAAFAPTIVANFAFLTRERLHTEGTARFIHTNQKLTAQFLHAASQPNVRLALTVSSGAAITEPEHPYGRLKLHEEHQALQLQTPTRNIVIARAYSVTGPHVRRPHDYAFSDFILQARTGTIHIRATTPVYRRYVSVADYLTVCLALGLDGWTGTIESGGDLHEIGDLAHHIAHIVNPEATITRAHQTSTTPSTYASDNQTWTHACRVLDYQPEDLNQQIRNTATPPQHYLNQSAHAAM